MVEHGAFETPIDHIILRPEKSTIDEAYKARFGDSEKIIPVERTNMDTAHMTNFLDCVRSRKQPALDAETAARTLVLVQMAAQSYREGCVLYFDEKTWRVAPKPFRA
jgi:hypothetical protein